MVFHIWYKMLDLFWSVRGLNSKLPTYPLPTNNNHCPLSPSRRAIKRQKNREKISFLHSKTRNSSSIPFKDFQAKGLLLFWRQARLSPYRSYVKVTRVLETKKNLDAIELVYSSTVVEVATGSCRLLT